MWKVEVTKPFLDDTSSPILDRAYIISVVTPHMKSLASIVHHSSYMYRLGCINTIVTLQWH